jgi:virginiamycin B lyase
MPIGVPLRAGLGLPALAAGLLIATACSSSSPSATRQSTSTPTVTQPTEPAETTSPTPATEPSFREFPVAAGTHPHDVAPAPDGRVWYTAQRSGELGVLEVTSGRTRHVPLGQGSAPHGVIVGPDGAPWITDGGLNAIVRVDPESLEVSSFPLPLPGHANLNTAAFDGRGVLWFTGQSGVYGRLDPGTAAVQVFDAPRGSGPYGIAATPDGMVWLASLAGSYIARIDSLDGRLTVVDVPTPGGGARRVWSDSRGRLWVTEWFAGKIGRYDPTRRSWREWALPGDTPQPYAVYVDEEDIVWVTDFGSNALVRFDPQAERFDAFPFPSPDAQVRQLLGRPGEIWGAESGTDRLVVLLAP